MTRRQGAAAPGAAVRVRLPAGPGTPASVLGAGAAAVALVCAVTASQISVLASLDETVYKLAAVNFAEGFPGALTGDPASRGLARLYSLLLMPLFAVLDGDQAVRAGRALNGILWAATALPVYLIARRVIASPRAAAAAAVLAVAVPWATLSLILFSEALSYLLFAWAIVAMLRALEAPSAGRDALAVGLMLVLVTARMQFAVLPFAWFAVVAILELRRGARRDPRSALRRHPVTFGLAILGVLLVLMLAVTGALRDQLDRFGGPYSGIQDRGSLPRDAGLALLSEVALLALGVGLVAAVLAAAWYRDALRGRLGEPALRLAAVSLAAIAVLFATTIWAQGGWLDDKTEERYYIYAVPFLWIGAVAALRDVELSAWRVLGGGLVVAALLFLVPVTVPATGEQMFLGPVSGIVVDATPRVDGRLQDVFSVDAAITRRDLAGWTAVAVAIGAALLWRRRRTAALVLSGGLQLLLVLYAFAAVHGQMSPVPGVTGGPSFSELGWVDRALDGKDAVVAENGGSSRDTDVLHSLFWNDAVRFRLGVGEPAYQPPYPADTVGRIDVPPGRGLAVGRALPAPVLGVRDSPQWQLDGRPLASPERGRLELVEPARPAQLRWRANGLDPTGNIVQNVDLDVAAGRRWVLSFAQPADGQQGRVRVGLGGTSRRVALDPGATATATFDLCRARGTRAGVIELEQALTPIGPGRYSAGLFTAARAEACS